MHDVSSPTLSLSSFSSSFSPFLSLTKMRPRMFHCGETCRFSCVWGTRVLRMYTCAYADGHGWRGCRGTDLLRGRPGSCPTLSRYTIIFLVVCALVSPRERYRPPSFFLSPVPPTLLSLDRCYGRVFRPSFIRLLALRELGAVGVPFLAVRSLGDLFVYTMYCIMFLSILNWIICRNKILPKLKKCAWTME